MSTAQLLLAALLVGAGGGLGSAARWGLRELGLHLAARGEAEREELRVRATMTFLANILACFVLGLVVARLGSAAGTGEYVYLLLAAGFCGGLSTMSSAASDVVELTRRGTFTLALAYLMLSIGAGMAMLWLGLVIAS
ncbi:fluoride efflux transporter FluC [Brachybacterium sp. UNK5269]|uniref:fluoride efflux transporter FluC n=1 Tax=Brachybacterium sp. UNK5269 TaxID=3408576 RepID=UPI003BAF762F